jgi:hypothetical protein
MSWTSQRRPERDAAAVSLGKDVVAVDSADFIAPQALRLAEHVARSRASRLERVSALKSAYAGLRRADELAPSNDLLDAVAIVLDQLAEDRADLARLGLFGRFVGLDGAP